MPEWLQLIPHVFSLRGPLSSGNHSFHFCHWKPMNVSPLLCAGILFELMVVGDTDNGVNCGHME